jgi:hypothetical protein
LELADKRCAKGDILNITTKNWNKLMVIGNNMELKKTALILGEGAAKGGLN